MAKSKHSKYTFNSPTSLDSTLLETEIVAKEVAEEVVEPPSVVETTTEDTASINTTREELEVSAKEAPIPKVAKEPSTVNKKNTTSEKGFTPVYKVEFALNNYMEAMDVTKIINPNEGARWQYSLLTTIKDVLNAPSQEEFNKEWNTILNFFNKNSKVPALTENFIFRFPSEWVGSQSEYKIFQHLVYLIVNTHDPKTRKKNILDINLDVMTEGLTMEQKNKIINFYLV